MEDDGSSYEEKLFSPANATQTLGTSAALCEKAELRHMPQGNILPHDTKACIPEEDYLPSPSIDKPKQRSGSLTMYDSL